MFRHWSSVTPVGRTSLSRAPAPSVVRDAIYGRPRFEVEGYHFAGGAGSSRTYTVALAPLGEVQFSPLARLEYTRGAVGEDVFGGARALRVRSVTCRVALETHVALFTEARATEFRRVQLELFTWRARSYGACNMLESVREFLLE